MKKLGESDHVLEMSRDSRDPLDGKGPFRNDLIILFKQQFGEHFLRIL